MVLMAGLGLQAGWPPQGPSGLVGFQNFGQQKGLTNLATTALAQDPDGFLWAGTDHGLFRLEGGHFHLFERGRGLPASRVEFLGLAPGVTRGLWINTGKGLSFWNGERFQRPSELGLPGLDDRQGLTLNQGGALIADPVSRTIFLSLDGEPFQPLRGLPWTPGLSCGTCVPGQDLLVLAFQQDLWVRQAGVWKHRDLGKTFSSRIDALWIDHQSVIYLRSSEVLARLASLEAPLEPLATPARLSIADGTGLGMDAEGRIWTNTAEGLIWLKGTQSGFIGETQGLPQGGAAVLCTDREGVIWIGGEGVHKLRGDGRWLGYTRHQGLPSDVVWSIARTRDQRVWLGTSGGLAVSGEHGWTVLSGTRSNQFLALEEDESGNLWAGHTISRERPTTLSVLPAGRKDLLPVVLKLTPAPLKILSIHGAGRTLWLGTSQAGLLEATRDGARLTAVKNVPIGLWPENTRINRVTGDGAGGLWVATDHGVGHWNGRTWATLDKSSGLPDDLFVSIAAMPEQNAWAATLEPISLCRFRRQGDHLILANCLLAPHPLLGQPILSLAFRPDGNLWLGTSTGLLCWHGQDIQKYGKDAGLPGEDCNQNALAFDPDGDPWVGLSVGVAHGTLGGIRPSQPPPATAIFAALRGDGRSMLDPAISGAVPWKGRTVTFRYCPRGTRAPEAVTYQVRLEGLEDAWRDTILAEARYPGLAPGRYLFEVRTLTWAGVPGPAQTLAFRVLPPWWLHPASLAGLALLMIAGGVITVRWRTQVLVRHNAALEALVQDRTRALSEANHALEEASLVDPLTTLRNRRFLELCVVEDALRTQRIYTELNRIGQDPTAEKEAMLFFLLDLDLFKQINDTWGHAGGDAVLVQFSAVLRAATRSSDTLIRWGGEEFLLVSKRAKAQDAHRIAGTLLAATRAKAFLLPGGETIPVTCSIGVAAFPFHPDHPELASWKQAIDMADQCLYAAKRGGRNRWVGAQVKRGAPLEPFERMAAFSLGAAAEQGLVEVASSEPEVVWKD